MRRVITDAGAMRLGDVELPGIYEGMEIRGEVRIDEVRIKGQSGKSRQPLGFEDAKVSLRLRLANDEDGSAEEKCRQIVGVFRSMDAQAKPYVYQIVNSHTALWQIREVIFKELRTADSNRDDTMRAYLDFEEYRPVLVDTEERADVGSDDDGADEAFAMDATATTGSGKAIASPAVDDDEV